MKIFHFYQILVNKKKTIILKFIFIFTVLNKVIELINQE